jgi:hypothetical protein
MRRLSQADMLNCPYCIMVPEHYRIDGSCRCNDAAHTVMAEWGYRWTGTHWQGEEDA